MNKDISRRDFLQKSALASAGAVLATSPLLARNAAEVAEEMAQQVRRPSANDRLNVVGVGIGGRGGADIDGLAKTENIIGLCDVDWDYAAPKFKQYPDAKKFKDYREMFDKLGKDIDAVVVGTADHTHAVISAQALEMGWHVYCEKPLTHTVYETRLLTKLAAKNKVATQMGN